MASLLSWFDAALGDVAKATGSDKNELLGGVIQSVVQTAQTGKATIVTNNGTATVTGANVTPNGLTVNGQIGVAPETLNKSLLWIGISIVVAVCAAVFLPKLIFKSKKRRY